jgi:uncharacterized protein YecE (DUF72 family)
MKSTWKKLSSTYNNFVRKVALSTTFHSIHQAQNFAKFAKPSVGQEFYILKSPKTGFARIREISQSEESYRNGSPSPQTIPKAFDC